VTLDEISTKAKDLKEELILDILHTFGVAAYQTSCGPKLNETS